jgi:hypothetical protein
MGFNKRRMDSERAAAAEKGAAARRTLGPQILEDAERLVETWNARQEAHMPMLFSPTIGAAIAARYWFLWVQCPGCRTTQSVDLRTIDRHRDAMVSSVIPALSCRSCRPNAPFAELLRLSQHSVADELYVSRARTVIWECLASDVPKGAAPKFTEPTHQLRIQSWGDALIASLCAIHTRPNSSVTDEFRTWPVTGLMLTKRNRSGSRSPTA